MTGQRGTSSPRSLEGIARLIGAAERVTVLTGAGISTDSGIPDFRGPQGLWTKDPAAERLSTLQSYMSDPAIRVRSWQARLTHPAWDAQPGPGHLALAELERHGRLHTLVTQNIDGLHQAAGSSPGTLIEIHGTLKEFECMGCGDRGDMSEALERVRAGEEDPSCRLCGGILKSATISFGQPLVRRDLEEAIGAARSSDVFIAIGTSLTVAPASHLPGLARDEGAFLVIVNAQPTPYDVVADTVLREPIQKVLPELVEIVKREA